MDTGNFGLVAEGADPKRNNDQVTLALRSKSSNKAFIHGSFTNAVGDTSITVYDYKVNPIGKCYSLYSHATAGPLI